MAEWTPARIEITDAESLAAATDALHDSFFDLKTVVFDEPSGLFCIRFWREVCELRRERKWWIFTGTETPFVRADLEFRHVTRLHVEDRREFAGGTLIDITYDQPRGLLLWNIVEPVKVRLEVGALAGEMRDIGEPTWDVRAELRKS